MSCQHSSRSAFGRSTGNIVYFSHRGSARYLAKVDWRAQKPRGKQICYLSRPHRPFWGSPAASFDFAGGGALQAVSECPGAARLVLSFKMIQLYSFQNQIGCNRMASKGEDFLCFAEMGFVECC